MGVTMQTGSKVWLPAALVALAMITSAGPSAGAPADMPIQAQPSRAFDLTRSSQVIRVGSLGAARGAAEAALKQIGSVIGTGDYRSLGFAHARDIQRATLGPPIRTAFLPLDRLAAYEDGKDAVPYLEDCDGLIFPVLVDGQVASGLFMSKQSSGWTMVGFGQPNKVKALEAARSSVASANHVDRGTLFDVEVPALDLTFVGRSQSNKLRMTPIEDMPTFGLTASREISAESALHTLSPAARNYEPVGVR